MERINEILALLESPDAISDEDLAALEAELFELQDATTALPTTPETVEVLEAIGTALGGIYAETDARMTAAAELTRRAEEALARNNAFRAQDGDDDETDVETNGDADGDDNGSSDDAGDDEDGDDDAEQPAEAAAPAAPARAATARRPASPARRVEAAPLSAMARTAPRAQALAPARNGDGRPAPRMTAAPDLRSFSAGQDIDWHQAGDAMAEMLESERGAANGSIKRRVATLDWRGQYPTERRLTRALDSDRVTELVRELVAPGGSPFTTSGDPLSIQAAGGLCAPLEVRYDVVDLSTADRPLRAGLPSMRADRGGLQWMSSPVLSDIIVDNTDGAIDTITVAADAGGATKTHQCTECGDVLDMEIEAISEILCFGNFADRYHPENVRAVMNVARAAHSRRAERGLLESMRAQSLQLNATAAQDAAGAWPKFLAVIANAAAHYRYQFRLSEEATLRVVLPTWLPALLITDLWYQPPGDGLTSEVINLRQQLTRQLGNLNVVPIWQRDDARTNNSNGSGQPGFDDITASGNLTDYRGSVEAILFHEGAFLFLDGGQLDFGIVRDSTLNAANQWQTFFEVFEAVAMVGYASWDLSIDLCASGTRAALTAMDCGGIGS